MIIVMKINKTDNIRFCESCKKELDISIPKEFLRVDTSYFCPKCILQSVRYIVKSRNGAYNSGRL